MATDETATADVWADDLLKRQEDAEFLYAFLVNQVQIRKRRKQQGSFVLNVDADWGAGKTFFITRFAKQLRQSDHVVAEIDAWRDDHVDDPFVAVLSAIDSALAPFIAKKPAAKKLWNSLKAQAVPIMGRVALRVGKALVRKHVGATVEELLAQDLPLDADVDTAIGAVAEQGGSEIARLADGATDALIKRFADGNDAADGFRERLTEALSVLDGQIALPMFVLVDELDRCRPSYSVALLERVKHLFEVENLVFVFATNSGQLQHSVKAAYGEGFNGHRYLQRFFERTYKLESPNVAEFIEVELQGIDVTKVKCPPGTNPTTYLSKVATRWDMGPRDIQRFMSIFETVVTVWPAGMKVDIITASSLIWAYLHIGVADILLAMKLPDVRLTLPPKRWVHDQSETDFSSQEVLGLVAASWEMMQSAIDLGNRDNLPAEQQYVYDVFSAEWNGQSINPRGPTLLRQLPTVITNAGKFIRRT